VNRTIHAAGKSCSTTDGIPFVGSQILGEIAVNAARDIGRKDFKLGRGRGKGRATSLWSWSCTSGRQQQGLSDHRKGVRSAGGYPMPGTDREQQRLPAAEDTPDKRAIQTGNRDGLHVCIYVCTSHTASRSKRLDQPI
jgi:hypothetical protein